MFKKHTKVHIKLRQIYSTSNAVNTVHDILVIGLYIYITIYKTLPDNRELDSRGLNSLHLN